jgi:outer membrane murein-binding lipoprotein Lpp
VKWKIGNVTVAVSRPSRNAGPGSCFARRRPSGGADLSSRGIAGVLIATLLVQGCSSAQKTEKRAFLAAGLALQREAPEPSFDDLRAEIDLYLNDELQDQKDRAKRQEASELDRYRKIWLIGSGATVLVATSGSLNNPGNRGFQYGLGAASAVVALSGFALYLVRTTEMKDCREFLDRGGQELSDWGRLHLVPSQGKVPRALWLDYVDRVAALRGHESCLRIR